MYVHIIIEALVFGVSAFLLYRKLKGMQQEIDMLKHQAMMQQQNSQELMSHIEQLYQLINKPGAAAAAPRKNKVSFAEPLQVPLGPQAQTQAPPQPQQQQQQRPRQPFGEAPQPQQEYRKALNPLDTIMNIMPSIMPAMMGSSPTSMIITELKKPMPKPDVEVVNDEDDPDVEAALREGRKGLAVISEENSDDE